MRIKSNKPPFSFNVDEEKAIIVIPSIKKNWLKIYSLVLSIVSFVGSIYAFYYLLIIEGQLIDAILGGVIGLFVSAVFFNSCIWVHNGYEYIEINKKTNAIIRHKKGWYIFDKKKIPLSDGEFHIVDDYTYILDGGGADELAFGVRGGKIGIKTQKGSYEFGVSISKEQAVDVVMKINEFLKKD